MMIKLMIEKKNKQNNEIKKRRGPIPNFSCRHRSDPIKYLVTNNAEKWRHKTASRTAKTLSSISYRYRSDVIYASSVTIRHIHEHLRPRGCM